MSKDLIETLRAGRSWEVEAADLIEQLKKENEELRIDNDFVRNKNASLKLKQKQLDDEFSGALLVAHMNGASSMRAELEKVTEQRDELTLYKNLADEYGLSVFADLEELQKQRDELLAAAEYALPYLQAFIPCPRDGANGDKNCIKRLVEALARVKGESK